MAGSTYLQAFPLMLDVGKWMHISSLCLAPCAGIDSFKPDPSLPHSHYTFGPCPGWRVIVIDGYDISLLGWPPGHPKHEEAVQILAERNPNVVSKGISYYG